MEKDKEVYLKIADTLEKVAQYLRDGDDDKRKFMTYEEYMERSKALRAAIKEIERRRANENREAR